jgi:hypothetical protein
MSINATTNYMSSSTIEAWMETKTEDLYGNMGAAMDESNTRADAEDALNKIKADIVNLQKSGQDAAPLQAEMNDALNKYGDVPEVAQFLQPIADELNQRMGAASLAAANPPQTGYVDPNERRVVLNGGAPEPPTPLPTADAPRPRENVTVSSDDSDRWTKQVDSAVDGLGKKDQLGLINIQEFNSQINQTKQIASALMDASDKSAQAIISHID